MAYYAWLRRLALDKLVLWRRFHIGTTKRSVKLEVPIGTFLASCSGNSVIDRQIDPGASPSTCMIRDEEQQHARVALESLTAIDRRVLELRYIEGLRFARIAAELGIGLSAVKMRHARALERFEVLMRGVETESGQ